jgi:hypothetical protein
MILKNGAPVFRKDHAKTNQIGQPGPQSPFKCLEQGLFVRRGRGHHLGGAGIVEDRGDRT